MYILIPPRFILKFPLATKLKNGLGWSQLEISQLISRTKDIKLEKITKNPHWNLGNTDCLLLVKMYLYTHNIYNIITFTGLSITRGWQCISDGVRIGLMPPPQPSPELQPPPAGWAAAVPQLRKMTKLKLIQSLTSFSFCCYRAKRGREEAWAKPWNRPIPKTTSRPWQAGEEDDAWPCHFVISPD